MKRRGAHEGNVTDESASRPQICSVGSGPVRRRGDEA